jgi:hypothetical protein
MKYCESKKEIEKNLEFSNLQIEEKQEMHYVWDKRRRKEHEYWKGFWDRMEACFGENCMNSRERFILKKARKVR